MTREEAKEILTHNWTRVDNPNYSESELDKAFFMAIEALSADMSSDLISRANAIRWVKTECNPYGKPTLEFESGKRVIEHLEQMPSANPETKWIPCSERLPSEKDWRVLVTKRGEVRIAVYSEFSGTWYLGEMCAVGGEDPIAWMPLPKPYREDGEA